MFRKILVPLDFTPENEPALRLAAELAAGGAEVVLLHVVETLQDVSFDEMKDFYERLEARARLKLGEAAAPLRAAGAQVREEVVYGRRAELIVAHAEAGGHDLILLSSHRVGPDRPPSGLGTISHRVAVLAGCPVLLVK